MITGLKTDDQNHRRRAPPRTTASNPRSGSAGRFPDLEQPSKTFNAT